MPTAVRLMSTGRGDAEEGNGYVFEPTPQWDRLEGGWRRPLFKRAVIGLVAGGATAEILGTRSVSHT